VLLGGCTGVTFVWQASVGQLDLLSRARDIDDVLVDPETPKTTREMLEEVGRVKSFASTQGLRFNGNYENYVAQESGHPEFVVWFVNASAPLSFEPKVFAFPIVGSFPGLGYWDERDAKEFASELREEGWDANIRGVRAFSTGGWFNDPVLWTMFADSENAYGYLANVLLHESVHATVLVKDQQYFNESLASFVADEMTSGYLALRFGEDSAQLRIYRERYELYRQHTRLMLRAFDELSFLYQSEQTDEAKSRRKRAIYAELSTRLEAETEINNATLVGIQLYQGAPAEFRALFEACGGSWPRLLQATGGLRSEHFVDEQTPDFGPVLTRLAHAECRRPAPVLPKARPLHSTPSRQQRERLRRAGR
jgi:predicted aminopeptidase